MLTFSEPVLKAKWKGLRDTFRAELKKELVYQKSNYLRNRPVWIHFKSLQFLKEQMVPRPPIWERNCSRNSENERTSETEGDQNGSSVNKSSHGDENLSIENGCIDTQLNLDTSNHQIEVKQEPEEGFQNLEFHNVSENLTDNEMMLQNLSPEQVLMGDGDSVNCLNIDPLEGNRCDDNYYFLMSLLPHIRTLPAERRMLLRMQMQELVYKEVYKKNSVENVSTS